MSSVVISGDTSGAITLSAPAVSGTNTATLPAATGTVMVSGNMPAFSATNNANQSISGSTWTKVAFQTKIFDTANCFDNTTNYRFTPTVAGYYFVTTSISHDWSSAGSAIAYAIYKNGTAYYLNTIRFGSNVGPYGGQTASTLIYMNGTTDYLESYGWSNNGTPVIDYGSPSSSTTFSAVLMRAS